MKAGAKTKLDCIIYSKTKVIGFFWFHNWYGCPSVLLKAENKNGWSNQELKSFKSKSDFTFKSKDKSEISKIFDGSDIGGLVPKEFWKSVAEVYAEAKYEQNKKIIYSDLAEVLDNDTLISLCDTLVDSSKEFERKECFKCYKVLAKRGDSRGFQMMAYCYHEGIGVEKSEEKVIEFMKKASELGDEVAKEWVKKYGA